MLLLFRLCRSLECTLGPILGHLETWIFGPLDGVLLGYYLLASMLLFTRFAATITRIRFDDGCQNNSTFFP